MASALSVSGGVVARVLAVAALSFREARRRWVVVAAFIMTIVYLALYGVALHYAAKDMMGAGDVIGGGQAMRTIIASQMLYVGLFPASLVVALIAIFSSVGAISGELDTGVLYGVLTRPIRRSELVVGKFLGTGTMLALYAVVMLGSVVGLAVWQMHARVGHIVGALALFVLEPLILLSLSLLGSTKLPTIASGVLVTAAYGIAFIGGWIEQIGSLIGSQVMANIGIVSSLLVPVDAMHRKAVSLLLPGAAGLSGMGGPAAVPFGSSAVPSVWMVVYAVAFTLVVIALAARALGRRDL
jgi:Cu-processing system permease protein